MQTTFPVEWQRLFKSLSIFMTLAIMVPLILFMGIRYLASGLNYAKTFEHISFSGFLLILACIPLVAVTFSFVIALWFRLATITISNEEIWGRNYWGLKNRIPLTDITKLTSFSNNGINAIVVNSRHHGKIYISDKTQRLHELLAILNEYLPEAEKLFHANPAAK